MKDTRTGLERLMTQGWQFKLFDYSKVATHWAARPEVAECLGRYLNDVSKAHRAAHGDGRVFVVAHSMGGLATAFAVDPAHGKIPDLASRIGGLVTLDTPWTGSAWGQSNYAALLSWLNEVKTKRLAGVLPGAATDAWVCLRNRSTATTDGGCDTAPYMPKSIPIEQIGGSITISRSFWGFHAYDIALDGDTIVRTSSQHGYLGSAAGSTLGFHTSTQTMSCGVSSESLRALAGTLGGPLGGWVGALSQLQTDSNAMDALAADQINASLVELIALVLVGSPCSHINMPKNPDALAKVAAALQSQASGPVLQPTDLLNAPIPADCGHKAGRLKNGELPVGPTEGFAAVRSNGKWVGPNPVLTDLTGDGSKELVGVLHCSAGGVDWPHRLLVYQSGPKLIGSIGLGDVTPAEHGYFTSLKASGGNLAATWETYEGCCFTKRTFSGTIHWDGDKLVVQQLRQLSGLRGNPFDWAITTTGVGTVTIGMTKTQASQAGLFATHPTGSNDCAWSTELERPVGLVVHVSTAADGRVSAIFLNRIATNKTPSGIGIGATLTDLKNAYGSRLIDAGDAVDVYGHLYGIQDKTGNFIAFLVPDGKVDGIQVSSLKYSPNGNIFYRSEWADCAVR